MLETHMILASVRLGLPIVFVVFKPIDASTKSMYRIENSLHFHMLLYRQTGTLGRPWQVLYPGEVTNYAWDEPSQTRNVG